MSIATDQIPLMKKQIKNIRKNDQMKYAYFNPEILMIIKCNKIIRQGFLFILIFIFLLLHFFVNTGHAEPVILPLPEITWCV